MGHLLLAQEARARLGLDEVMLVTTGRAPHKQIEDDPGAEVRLEMTRAAAAAEEGVDASALEVEREGPSYTHLTLAGLAEAEPERELVLLLGADAAAGLEEWEQPQRVVELARIGVVPRPGVEMDRVGAVLGRLGAADRAEVIEMPVCGASSTLIRERTGEGLPLRHLVPDPVIALIEQRGLYR